MNAILNFPGNSRTHYRGCSRESYAQPGYWNNAGRPTTYWTTAMGQPTTANAPGALQQTVSAHYRIGAPATENGQTQFKMRVNYCGPGLGLKN